MEDVLHCSLCGPGSVREGCDFKHLECCGGKGIFRYDTDAYATCSRCSAVASLECLKAWALKITKFDSGLGEADDLVDDRSSKGCAAVRDPIRP